MLEENQVLIEQLELQHAKATKAHSKHTQEGMGHNHTSYLLMLLIFFFLASYEPYKTFSLALSSVV